VLTDTVKHRDFYFELYSLWHWEPMKHVAKSWRDVFVSADTDDQTRPGSLQDQARTSASMHRAVLLPVLGTTPNNSWNFSNNRNLYRPDYIYLTASIYSNESVFCSGCSGLVVEHRTRKREAVGSTRTRSTTNHLDQVANLVRA